MTSNKSELLSVSNSSAPEEIPWIGETTIWVKGMHADDAGKVGAMADRVTAFPDGERECESLLGWLVLGVCTEQGEPMFNDEDLPKLRVLPLTMVQRVSGEIMRKSGNVTAKN